MKIIPYIILSGLLLTPLHADEGVLLQRVIELEKRVAELEEKLAPVLEEERVKGIVVQQKKLAHERMLLDAEYYPRVELNLIEKAYQTGSKDWTTEEAGNALKLLVEKFPRANRTGCAVLAFAQASDGSEQMDYLEDAIGKYSGCYYGNGVQVGAYARLYLGMRYKKEGQDQKAAALFEEIRSNYANAIDHKGQLLTSHLDDLN